MATKDLGRTAIEGGRTTYYKNRVREIEASFRTANRKYEHRVANDSEAYDDVAEPLIHPKSKKGNQTDHLNPVYKMLDSMVGRPWAKVFSEICQKFDGRTLAGRHVLYEHILTEIDPHPHVGDRPYYLGNDYFVNDHGIFSKRVREKRRFPVRKISLKYAKKIAAWLNGRALIRQGTKLFWGFGSYYGQACEHVPLHLHEYHGEVTGLNFGQPTDVYPYQTFPSYSWRQNQGLSREETAFFNSMPKWVHNIIVVHGAVDEKAA